LFIKSKQIDLFREILDELKIEHYTAPYEADAQMAYFVREGIADFAITEDSDLIAFGCPKIVVKMNYAGYGEVFDIREFRAETNTAGWEDKLVYFKTLNDDQMIETCIMAGCEYI
jgi:exonuclease 1